ncbi:MAG: amidohydrolase [Anaerolineae bacterium]|jgi:cytosine/adenosine deaminase-related metal-dependent hydrolase
MIFENVTILTMNAERQILEGGAVAVTGSKIVAVGKNREILDRYPEKRCFNCNGNILMPGLIDTHVHLAQCMLRGMSWRSDSGLFGALTGLIWPMQGSYTEEDGRASAALCILEMLKSGTTAFVETLLAENYGFDGIAELCVESGIRAALGKVVMDISPEWRDRIGMHPGMWQTRGSSIANTLAAHDRWEGAGEGRLQVWFGCRSAAPRNNPSLFDEVSQLARERDMGLTIHFSEQPVDVEYARSLGFRSPTEFGAAHGLLGPRHVWVHYVMSDAEDWKLVAESGTHISHNPANNSYAGWGPAPVWDMLQAGVNVSLGCDSAPMDLLRDLHEVSSLARIRAQSREVMPPETVLEMATINGARAMGIDAEVGSIEAGKRADFIVIDMDAPHLTPVWNPVATVVRSAVGSDVDTVVIDGRIVMQGREMLTLDEEAIVEEVRRRYRAVAKRAGIEQAGSSWPLV